MKLYDRRFVSALKQEVRREVKTRLEWREIVRRRRWAWLFRYYDGSGLRWFMPLLLANLGFFGAEKDALWVGLSLWAIFIAMLRIAQFQVFHSRGGGMMPFACLPVSTKQVFDHGNAGILRSSLWLLVDVLAALSVCALRDANPIGVWLGAAPTALIIWLSALSTAVFLFWRFPRVPYFVGASGFFILTVIGSSALPSLTPQFSAVWPNTAAFVLWATPVGWAGQLGRWLTGHAPSFPVVAAGLLMIWLALAVSWYRAIAARTAFWQLADPTPTPPRANEPLEEAAAVASEPSSRDPKPVATAEEGAALLWEAELRRGEFLRPFFARSAWQPLLGWVERLVLKPFRREAALLDFMMGIAPPWSRYYAIAVILLVIGAVAAKALSPLNTGVGMWISSLLSGLALCLVTPLLGGHWPGFFLGAFQQQRNIAVMATLPIDLRAASRLVLGINSLRFLLALPCWMAAGFLAAPLLHVSVDGALQTMAGIWTLALVMQPIMVVAKYSMGTNDTNRWYVFLGVVAFCCVMLAALVGAVAAIFSGASFLWQMISVLIVAAVSSGSAAIYQRLYFGQHFDLLAKRPPTATTSVR